MWENNKKIVLHPISIQFVNSCCSLHWRYYETGLLPRCVAILLRFNVFLIISSLCWTLIGLLREAINGKVVRPLRFIWFGFIYFQMGIGIFEVEGLGALRQSAPETIYPKTMCPGENLQLETICPGRQHALETIRPRDNMPWHNMPQRLHAPRHNVPWRQCGPGDNVPQETICLGRPCAGAPEAYPFLPHLNPRLKLEWVSVNVNWHTNM